jgi:hypothetical protein
MLGGGSALASHVVKTSMRAGVNTSPEPFSNIAASLLEDLGVAGLVSFAVFHPSRRQQRQPWRWLSALPCSRCCPRGFAGAGTAAAMLAGDGDPPAVGWPEPDPRPSSWTSRCRPARHRD